MDDLPGVAVKNLRTGGWVTLTHRETGGYGDGSYHWGSTLDNVRR